ncbi:MAG: hypothetical protein OTJ43_03515 [Dehalococcoidia bacterium]|nr:hypothetical protein [Dehalococcoidia bacterium]
MMNTQEELQEAFSDHHTGKLGVIPPDVMPHTSPDYEAPGV